MATKAFPAIVEQQLRIVDRQVRDGEFFRGLGALMLTASLGLLTCFVVDGYFGLNGTGRAGLLGGWALLVGAMAWFKLIRPAWRPTSYAELAAVVERQHPELAERLTSLVELCESASPGASRLMAELLARQTAKAMERLELSAEGPVSYSPRMLIGGLVATVLLLAPFLGSPSDYGLCWARLFHPFGNHPWGRFEIVVDNGDRIVARGSDVPITVSVRERVSRWRRSANQESSPEASRAAIRAPLWMSWRDTSGVSDTRRLEWDDDAKCFTTTLPHVFHGFDFDVSTRGARSRTHRIQVANRPVLTASRVEVESPPYTGLPAASFDALPAELRVVERSQIRLHLHFAEPVVSAQVAWPMADSEQRKNDPPKPDEKRVVTTETHEVQLAPDRLSGTLTLTAMFTGPFDVRLRNDVGLEDDDPERTLTVDRDLPPAISLRGKSEPQGIRPEDRFLVGAAVRDDFGLTAIELHLETSLGNKRVVPIDLNGATPREHSFEVPIDAANDALTPGQSISYRLKAVDNRPVPQPQETWSELRTLMIQSKPTPSTEAALANASEEAREQLKELRAELAATKGELGKLHSQTEKESLTRSDSDKSAALTKLEQRQAEIEERLRKLAAELAERPLTEKLADKLDELAEREMGEARRQTEAAKTGEPRDQLTPLSKAIDRLAAVEKQLQQMEQQLNELDRLEKDLEELNRLALRAERLAEQLDQLDRSQPNARPDQLAKTDEQPPEKSADANPDANKPDPQEPMEKSQPSGEELEALNKRQKQLTDEGRKLTNELKELLRKHPELLDVARDEQVHRLEQLARQAAELAKPQQQLADALKQDAANAPASAMRTANPSEETPMDAAATAKQESPSEALPDKAQPATERSADNNSSDKPTSDNKPSTPTEKDSSNGNPKPDTSNADGKSNDSSSLQSLESNKKTSPTSNEKPARSQDGAGQLSEEAQREATDKSAGANAVGKQQQIAQQAVRQAIQIAREFGADSEAAQSAAEFAKESLEAARRAQTGQLDEAAQSGKAAAESADATAKQLSPEGVPSGKAAQQASALAKQQAELSHQMQELAQSEAARRGAREQGQRSLEQAAASLQERLDNSASQLSQAPLNAKGSAEAAARAGESARQAREAMQQSAQAAKGDDPQAAADQAEVAAKRLQQAGESLQQESSKSNQKNNSNPIPGELAARVTDSARELDAAQQRLADAKQGEGKQGEAKPSDGKSEGKPSEQPANGAQSKPGSSPDGGSDQPASPNKGASQQQASNSQAGSESKSEQSSTNPSSGKSPSQSGNQGKPTEGNGPSNTDLAQAADQFRRAAQAMRSATQGERAAGSESGEQTSGQQTASQSSKKSQGDEGSSQEGAGRPNQSSEESAPPDGAGIAAGGGNTEESLAELETELKRQSQRNWGKLSGNLRTEILQGANKKPHPGYAKQIKTYFDTITKSTLPESQSPVPKPAPSK